MTTVSDIGSDEIVAAARGIATAVCGPDGMQPVQQSLLGTVLAALHGLDVDLASLDPIEPDELAVALAHTDSDFRHRVVHKMVLGELILKPIPLSVATRVGRFATALEVEDRFVRIAHRYAQGGFGLAWKDLYRSGFAEHWEAARMDHLKSDIRLADQLSPGVEDPKLAEQWMAFEDFPAGSLGRMVWEMYRGRGFGLPGTVGGAAPYLAQHDFVHVLADYGTNLNGEIETFGLIARSDPDPKGFAWLATLIGLFETGYVADAGFFSGDLKEKRLDSPEMHTRLADALRRGKLLCERLGKDLLEVDYHALAPLPVQEARAAIGLPPKGEAALAAGSPSLWDRSGMSLIQQRYADALAEYDANATDS